MWLSGSWCCAATPSLAAVGYGLFVWCVMNLVVLPLSRVPQPKSFNPTQAIIGALILVAFIGFPVSLRARRYFGAGDS